jgi:hypothetical protein
MVTVENAALPHKRQQRTRVLLEAALLYQKKKKGNVS